MLLPKPPSPYKLIPLQMTYETASKVWHPDRFHDDPKFQVRATKKIQDINAAYQLLETHYQTPPPLPNHQSSNDEMFERWAKDKQRQQQSPTIPSGQPFPNFTTLEDLCGYFSLNLPYHVYPCRIHRSNDKQLTPDRISRISFNVLLIIILLTFVFKMPPNLMIVCGMIAGTLKLVDLYGKLRHPPDALILTELGVVMVEGIVPAGQQFTATTAHTFPYEHLIETKWNDEEISFVTMNGLRFSFMPTSKDSLTVPDTKWFKVNVFSAAQVVAHLQNKQIMADW